MNSEILPKGPLSRHNRYKIIAEGITEGLNYQQIAKRCGVTERTIYTDRQHIDYQQFIDIFMQKYFEDLSQALLIKDDNGKPKHLTFVIQEKGKLLRAMLPRRIEAKAEVQQILIKPTFSKLLETDYEVLEDDSKPT